LQEKERVQEESMALKNRIKLKSGIKKLKRRGRGPVPSSAERRARRTSAKDEKTARHGQSGKLAKKSSPVVTDNENLGYKGASNRGDKPQRKFANAQNQSKQPRRTPHAYSPASAGGHTE
jgi:hypothetical protein